MFWRHADRRDLYIVTADNTDAPDRKGTIFRTPGGYPRSGSNAGKYLACRAGASLDLHNTVQEPLPDLRIGRHINCGPGQ